MSNDEGFDHQRRGLGFEVVLLGVGGYGVGRGRRHGRQRGESRRVGYRGVGRGQGDTDRNSHGQDGYRGGGGRRHGYRVGSRGQRGRGGRRPNYARQRFRHGRNYDGNAEPIPEEPDSSPTNPNIHNSPLLRHSLDVISQWKLQLPGFDEYYFDTTPQLLDFMRKVSAAEAFFDRINFATENAEAEKDRWDEIADSYYLLHFDEVVKDVLLLEQWPEFNSDLTDKPEETITLWSVTAHKVMYNLLRAGQDSECSNPENSQLRPKIKIGFSKLEPITPLLAIKATHLGKFISVRASISRTGNIRCYCHRLTFCCTVCETEYVVNQPEGSYTPPRKCKMEDCPNKNPKMFKVKEYAPTNIVVDSRRIRLQSSVHCDNERGSITRTIDCILFGELAEQCSTGDVVTVSGVVKMSKEKAQGGEESLHHMYIEASSIIQQKDFERSMGGHIFSFTNKDYYAVREIHDTPDLFRLLIASLCPSIYGHEVTKAGLLLCLFGGTQRQYGIVSRRSDINMLMVGDPGIGKSQMLKVLTQVAPRGVYVCGTGSTVAGLTASLVRDGEDFSLEAGALVMADNGICCIDEFDKMTPQHHALLEALEQQSVSIAKSGIYRTLPARTTVIAAANPVDGHYDPCKAVSENIKINQPLLSRFDLIFILLDRPDKKLDRKLIQHMLNIRNIVNIASSSNRTDGLSAAGPSHDDSESNLLINRIKIRHGERVDVIPHVLLQKYIAYAKRYVNPMLSSDAAEALKKYYLNLRLSNQRMNSTPVTTRQLESLVRLTEARAKAELREVATIEDAKDVLEIFDFGVSSIFGTNTINVSDQNLPEFPIDCCASSSAIPPGRPKSVESQAKKLLETLQQYARAHCKTLFSVDEIKYFAASFGARDLSDGLITCLNNQGFLLKKSARVYLLLTI